MAQPLQLGGKSPSDIYNDITKAGISQADASLIVSGWIYQNFGKVKHFFDYVPAFPATNPNDVSHFAQSFHHTDWVDGESVVQAAQTVGEDGFNLRLHRIETDLAALGTEVARAFSALVDLRSALSVAFDELRTEINRINSDVYDCCSSNQPIVSFPPFGGVVKNPKFMGVTKFNNQDVNVWQTEQGTLVLPAIKTAEMDITSNPRVDRMNGLIKFVEDNANVRTAFNNQPFTTQDFITKFGQTQASNGMLVKDLVQILPATTQFKTVDELVAAVNDRESSALRTSGDLSTVLSSTLGMEAGAAPALASIDKVNTIPDAAKAALAKAGIDTVDRLSAADPKRISDILTSAGITGVTLGDTKAWTNTATVLKNLA